MGVGVKVRAVPHDLLKVVDWRRHVNRGVVERFLPEEVRKAYRIACRNIEGKIEYRDLEQVIEGHHSTKGFWRRLWAFSDRLSTVAGRFRLEYDYWHSERAYPNPFFVRVYGDIKEWAKGDRDKLSRKIIDVLRQYYDKESEHVKAFEEINYLVRDFPADSRFPYTSLRTHHWLTDVIRENDVFWLKCKMCTERGEKIVFDKMFMLRVSIAEPEYHKHRLKEIRGFIELRSKILNIASDKLSKWNPIQIGDDLYIVCLKESEINSIINSLTETGFGYDLAVFEWDIGREEKKVDLDEPDEKTPIYVLKNVKLTPLSIGVYEEFEFSPESSAQYSRILESEYDYIAWISIMPKGDMKELAEEFLEWGENELRRRYDDKRVKLPESVSEPEKSPFLSPEIALSIAEGYNEFLEDCSKEVNAEKPEESIVTKSFSRTIFICGLDQLSEAYWLYRKLTHIKANLHIPILLSIVVARPKYPFWRISEQIMKLHEKAYKSDIGSNLVFVIGEKMVELTDEHAKLIERVIPKIQKERKGQFYKIVNSACKDSKGILKVKIKGLAKERKIKWDTALSLCKLVDDIAKRYNNEKLRKEVTCEIFKILRMFTS